MHHIMSRGQLPDLYDLAHDADEPYHLEIADNDSTTDELFELLRRSSPVERPVHVNRVSPAPTGNGLLAAGELGRVFADDDEMASWLCEIVEGNSQASSSTKELGRAAVERESLQKASPSPPLAGSPGGGKKRKEMDSDNPIAAAPR